uniref:Uncharacterized protein LOC111110774 n=1 Tax=Crassostrea virginica TaxID=6565 RepID=A0A8B8BIJ3_CRAVI|nr:uncharacterized protein LOC111110774 [Crassostrea virginica]
MNSAVNAKFCKCNEEGAEYFCHTCHNHYCRKCQQEHATNLDTKHHSNTLYRNISSHVPNKKETCSIHLECTYQKFCESCNIPICGLCKGHRKHKKLELLTAYESKQRQMKEQIFKIRCDTIYQFQIILTELKDDIKHCLKEKEELMSAMIVMSRKIKNEMDKALGHSRYHKDLHSCSSQLERIKKHINKIQYYEQIQERLIKRPVKFLKFIKTLRPPSMEDTPSFALHGLLSMTPDINVKDLIKPLTKIKMIKKDKRCLKNSKLLKVILPVNVISSYVITDVDRCHHISCVTPDRVWVNDGNSLILADTTTGVTLKRLPILRNLSCVGLHSVNSERELIYIENFSTVNKYCNDMTTKTILKMKKRRNSDWLLLCLYCSPSSGDLLIGKKRCDINESKIARYNKQGKLTQTIQNDKNGKALYKFPRCITENNNGDVVVSDIIDESHGAVVVTDRYGRRRFSYTGHPPGSKLLPLGICTDALSNILVCDLKTQFVHVIEENGKFFSTWGPLELDKSGRKLTTIPYSLSYDVNTHLLWVGSGHGNVVSAFRYIHRHPHLTDKIELFEKDDKSRDQQTT